MLRLQEHQMQEAARAARHPAVAAGPGSRLGFRDPWLNRVAIALAEIGFNESERNTATEIGGVPMEGDIGLVDPVKAKVLINLFSSNEQARQAEMGLRTTPLIGAAVAQGDAVIHTEGPVMYLARGQGRQLDPSYLDDVVKVVGQIGLPPPPINSAPAATPADNRPARPAENPMDQLRKLGELRDAGVVTAEEFEAKKAELLAHI
jgi:hypothetical protein